MRRHITPLASPLRWFARMHSIHAVLIAVATLGAVLPSARYVCAPSAVRADAQQNSNAADDDDDRDRNQNQDRDTDQDRDLSDLTKLFVASESEENGFFSPKLILVSQRGAASGKQHAVLLASARKPQTHSPMRLLRPVYTRTCRLML